MLSFNISGSRLEIALHDSVIYTIAVGQKLLQAGRGSSSYKMSHGSFKIKEKLLSQAELTVKGVSLSEDRATVELSQGSCRIEIIDGNKLYFTFNIPGDYNRMEFDIPAVKEECVYGCGENFSEFNLRGKCARVWVAEHINALQIAKKLLKQVVGIKNTTKKQPFSNYESYYAQPTFLSSRKYFFHSTATARGEFDFKNPTCHKIKIWEIAPFYIGFGEDFEQVLSNLSTVLGRQPDLPDWTYDGYILGIQGGTDIMMNKVNAALNSGVAVNGVWIQDWVGRRVTAAGKQLYWNWQWDRELYPRLD